jgi:mRNA-degrading endonuclease toxin of MazEF toxin-antitoxin module
VLLWWHSTGEAEHRIGEANQGSPTLPAAETGTRLDSKAQAEQVRSISVTRIGPALGKLSPALMAALDNALRLHLQL